MKTAKKIQITPKIIQYSVNEYFLLFRNDSSERSTVVVIKIFRKIATEIRIIKSIE